MSKVFFRARALDASKPLPIYYGDELPDLPDFTPINRQVPQMPTGMEKEEELESHLQQVIMERQTMKETSVVIPIPEPAIPIPHYDLVYKPMQQQPLTYVRLPGLGLEDEVPDYDLDSEDEEWISVQSQERPLSPTHFERLMDKLERGSGNTVLSVRDAQLLLKDEEDLVLAVYDYWLAKRLRLGRPLIPMVKHERRDGTSSSSPYLAFRKRTEKMQTRKNRKNDEQAYMHMLKLKRDLSKAIELVEKVKERETTKHDISIACKEIFRKRYQLEDWSGSILTSLRPVSTTSHTTSGRPLLTDGLLIKVDGGIEDGVHTVGRHDVLVAGGSHKKRKAKKKHVFPQISVESESPLSNLLSPADRTFRESFRDVEKPELSSPDGPFTFKRKLHVRYHTPLGSLGEWQGVDHMSDNNILSVLPKKYRFYTTSLNGRCIGKARRRAARGGRTIWDRVNDVDDLLMDEIEREDEEEEVMEEDRKGGEEEGEQQGDTPQRNSIKRDNDNNRQVPVRSLHFYPQTPPPCSHFVHTFLPFVDPSTYSCPDLTTAYGQFGGTMVSDGEDQVEALSFSSLPTSQFVLRPFTSEMDVESLDGQSEDAMETAPPRMASLRPDSEEDRPTPVPPKIENQDSLRNQSPSTDQPETGTSSAAVNPSLPPSQLTSIQGGLPVQIHVENIKFLPKKDSPSQQPTNLSASKGQQKTSQPAPSQVGPSTAASSSSVTASLKDSRPVTGSSSNQLPACQEPNTSWFAEEPSSMVGSLNSLSNVAKRYSRLHRRPVMKVNTSKHILASHFKDLGLSLEKKKEENSDSGSTGATSASTPALPTASRLTTDTLPLTSTDTLTSRTPSQAAPSANVFPAGGLATAGSVQAVREKRGFPTFAGNHQKSSPNGVHDGRKLTMEQELKQALSSGVSVVNHSGLVDGATNSLVQLPTPSEVT